MRLNLWTTETISSKMFIGLNQQLDKLVFVYLF